MKESYQGTSGPSLAIRLRTHFRSTMIGGLLLMLPLIITYVLLKWLFDAIDGLLQPVIQGAFGRQVPGIGLIALVLLVYVLGLLEGNYLGRRMLDLGRAMLFKIPVVRSVYSPAKRLIDALSGTGDSGFRQVVLIEYPRKDAWTIGFLTANTQDSDGSRLSVVYIPTAPTPNSGWISIIPEKDVRLTDLSVATAMHLVLSGGIIAPPVIGDRKS